MNEAPLPVQSERILVALDASPHSVAALKAAAELAALLDVELEGMFVEDINLLYLSSFPFCREIGSYTAKARRMDNATMERQLRILAGAIQRAMERVAAQTPVRWSFHVRRGPVVAELLAAAQSASLLSLGRAGRLRRTSLGSTARSLVSQSQRPLLILGEGSGLEYPLTVVYTGSPAAQRGLEMAARLAVRHSSPLRVLLWDGGHEKVDTAQLEEEARARLELEQAEASFVIIDHSADLLETLRHQDGGTLVLPGEHAALVGEHSGPTLLIP